MGTKADAFGKTECDETCNDQQGAYGYCDHEEPPTLVERLREDPEMSAKIDEQKSELAEEVKAEEPKPLTEADLDPEYYPQFQDLKVYTRVLATVKFYGSGAVLFQGIDVLDVDATHAKIEAAKARRDKRRAAKFRPHVCANIIDTGASRQVRRRAERVDKKGGCKCPQDHVGFNRQSRKDFIKKMPRKMRQAVKKQVAESRRRKPVVTESLDKPAEA